MIGLLFPKPKKSLKKPTKAVKRSALKKGKTKFKAFRENIFKDYHLKHTDAETALWATEQSQGRIDNPTDAERAMRSILRRLGIRYEAEKIWPNGDHPAFSDLWLPDYKLTIEADGETHRNTGAFDKARALWLARTYGVGTVRFKNAAILNGKAEAELRKRFGLPSEVVDDRPKDPNIQGSRARRSAEPQSRR